MKLIKGDTVNVIRGKDAGKTAKVEKIFGKDMKVLLPGINEYKRHMKARNQNEKSDIITITKPLPMSNVALVCPQCKKETRVGFKINKDTKIRICRKCGKAI